MFRPSVDPPYKIYGGIFREEAIMLLRRFYVQENEKGVFCLPLPSSPYPWIPPLPRVSFVRVDKQRAILTYMLAPEPKQKKNRELKTEIMPVSLQAPEG